MVPLLVVLTILTFVVADQLVQAYHKTKTTPKKSFNPATDPIVFNGELSWADGGEPLETEEEQRTGKSSEK